jgi:RimJ/RimL family protein N-acetyltransferase
MSVYLETPRLRLRDFTEDDADHLIELDADPAVTRLLNGGRPTPPEVVREQILPRFLAWHARGAGYGYWAAIERASGDFLGWFHLRPPADDPAVLELGYRLRRAAWGRGYATEGALALVAQAFDALGARRVMATTLAENTASIRVMEKAGLSLARRFRYDGPDPAAWHVGRDAVEYALDRDAYRLLPTSPP